MVVKMEFIDVSSYQPDTLEYFEDMKRRGAEASIAKITQGTNYINPKATNQINNADKVMMKTAGYHFAEFGGNIVEAEAEANFFISEAKKRLYAGSYLVLDYEEYASGDTNDNTDAVLAFMGIVKRAGYTPLIYSYKPYFTQHLDMGKIGNIYPNSVWVAGYPASNTADFNNFPSMDNVWAWQYSNNWQGTNTDGSIMLLEWNEEQTGDNEMANTQGEHVYESNGKWYLIDDKTGAKTDTIANGIVAHMGNYWVFNNGEVVRNRFVTQWGYVYWATGDGIVASGTGEYAGMKFEFGDDNTYFIKNIKITDAQVAGKALNSMKF